MTHPIAALIAGVKRYPILDNGNVMYESEVLAALEAAPVPDLVEAGKVLEGVTPGPWEFVPGGNKPEVCQKGKWPHGYLCTVESQNFVADARFIAWCREGVPALLALATAQAAQIAGLTKEREHEANGRKAAMAEFDRKCKEANELHTALAAERAKVAKLVGGLQCAKAIMDTPIALRRLGIDPNTDARLIEFRAALSEAEARDE